MSNEIENTATSTTTATEPTTTTTRQCSCVEGLAYQRDEDCKRCTEPAIDGSTLCKKHAYDFRNNPGVGDIK